MKLIPAVSSFAYINRPGIMYCVASNFTVTTVVMHDESDAQVNPQRNMEKD